VGSADGLHYLAMKLIDGPSLETELHRFVADPKAAARLTIAISQAVDYAHRRGVLHRDLKPANILLDGTDTPYVSDLGLAKQIDLESDGTTTGSILGTPSYMSPEQADGAAVATTSADVYGLGAVLYAALTGRPPHQGSSPLETCRLVVEQEVVPPHHWNPGVDKDLETICLKCLAKVPGQRYASAGALSEDLERWMGNRPILARRAKPTERVVRWCRRRPALSTSLAAATLLLLVVLFGSPLAAYWWRAERNRALTAESTSLRREQETRRALFRAYSAQAGASRAGRRPQRRFEGLRAVAKAAELARALSIGESDRLTLRNHTTALLALSEVQPSSASPIPFSESPYVPNAFFDPALRRYCCGAPDGTTVIHSVATGERLATLPGPGQFSGFQAFGPKGRLLAASFHHSAQRQFTLYDIPQRRIIVSQPLDLQFSALAFSSNGKSLAVGGRDGTIHFFDTTNGAEVRTIRTGQTDAFLCFTPDDTRLEVCGGGSTVVKVYRLDDGALVAEHRLPSSASSLSWHPDQPLLAAACADNNVYIWDTDRNMLSRTLVGHSATVVNVAYDRPGEFLASHSWDGTTRLWDPMRAVEVMRIEGAFRRFSSDGRKLALVVTQQGKAMASTWKIAPSKEFHRFLPPSPVSDTAISSDGEWIASAHADGVRIWERARARELDHLPGTATCNVWFDPVAERVITAGADGIKELSLDHLAEDAKHSTSPRTERIDSMAAVYADISKNRRFVAFSMGGTHLLLRDRELHTLSVFDGRQNLHAVAVSADGAWIAGYPGPGVKIWNCQTGVLKATVMPHKAWGWMRMAFSPDGRWLVTGSSTKYRFWSTRDWKVQHAFARDGADIGGPITFTSDSRLAVIASSRYLAKLIDVATGTELVTLEAPDAVPDIAGFAFGQDGKQLSVSGKNQVLHCWDLERIRVYLEKLGIGWQPSSPSETTHGEDAHPTDHGAVENSAGGGGTHTTDSLIEDLTNQDWRIRRRAANELQKRCGSDPSVGRRLATVVTDADSGPFLHRRICRVLADGHLNDSVTVERLRALTLAPPSIERAWTIAALAAIDRVSVGGDDRLPRTEDEQEQFTLGTIAADWNSRAWEVASRSDRSKDEYVEAEQDARAAARLLPDNGNAINTLGVALYRSGHWQEALECLGRSRKLNAERFGSSLPADVAFLAMAEQQLGRTDKAKGWLDRLEKMLSVEPWSSDSESRSLLREARQIVTD